MKKTVLITGCNRGIGLEFVHQYAVNDWHVIACCRNPVSADALNRLAAQHSEQISIYPLDVANHSHIEQLAHTLSGMPLIY